MVVNITYFVHGTTTDNLKDLATGWEPGKLSSLGIRQNRELGRQVSGRIFDAVFCSDLSRSIETAKMVFGSRSKIFIDARLREAHYGKFTMKKSSSFKPRMAEFVDKPFPEGERLSNVELRIRHFLEYLKRNYDNRSIAIVGHQAPQLALDVILTGKTWKQAIAEDWRHRRAWQPGWEYLLA